MVEAKLQEAKCATRGRLTTFPGHPLFLHAMRELDQIEDCIAAHQPPDRRFYESLNVGLMCARELEAVDLPFCETIYALLEAVRLRAA